MNLNINTLKNEGITGNISYTDIIELAVEEKLNLYKDKAKKIYALKDILDDKIKLAIHKSFNKEIKLLEKQHNLPITSYLKIKNGFRSETHHYYYLSGFSDDLNNLTFGRKDINYQDNAIITGEFVLNSTLGKLPTMVHIYMSKKIKFSKEIKDLAILIDKETNDFLNSLPENNTLSEKHIIKSLKNQFTRKALQSMPINVQKSLNAGLNLKI